MDLLIPKFGNAWSVHINGAGERQCPLREVLGCVDEVPHDLWDLFRSQSDVCLVDQEPAPSAVALREALDERGVLVQSLGVCCFEHDHCCPEHLEAGAPTS